MSMTEEMVKQKRIAASAAKMRHEHFAALNTYGLSVDDQINLDANYQMAKDIWLDAEAEYQKALREWLPHRGRVWARGRWLAQCSSVFTWVHAGPETEHTGRKWRTGDR